MEARTRLNEKQLFQLWVPLALMWLVMAAEQPAVTSIISRLSNPTVELAAFGHAFALALMIEGPVVQMLSAGTALGRSRDSYRKLLAIMHMLAGGTTMIHLLFCIPSVFRWVSLDVMNLPVELYGPAYKAFVSMIPWSAAVGYRRLWQGVMIRGGRSREVPYIMYIRMGTAALVLGTGLALKNVPGAMLGGMTLSIGVISGMIAAWLYVRPVLEELPASSEQPLRFSKVISFYIPLALTSLITLGVRPLLNLGIAKGLYPLQSLALWPVVLAYMFIYTSISLSMQEIVIAQLTPESVPLLRRFTRKVALGMSGIFLLIFVSPLWKLWFITLSGLPESLLEFLPITLGILIIMPYLAGTISYYRGVLVTASKTRIISTGVFLNAGSLFLLLLFSTRFFPVPGIYAAAGSYVSAFIIEASFLHVQSRRQVSELTVF